MALDMGVLDGLEPTLSTQGGNTERDSNVDARGVTDAVAVFTVLRV